MRVSPVRVGQVLALSVAGRIDATNSHDFLTEVNRHITFAFPGTPVVMDLKELSYASSAGLRVMLALAQSLKEADRPMALHSLCAPVEDALKISGFNNFIDIAHDLDHALSMVSGEKR